MTDTTDTAEMAETAKLSNLKTQPPDDRAFQSRAGPVPDAADDESILPAELILPDRDAPKKAPTKIKVIEVRQALVDLATAGQEELTILLTAAQEVPELSDSPVALNAFLDIARTLQGPLAPFLAAERERGIAASGASSTIDAILIRELVMNPAVRPIIVARGAAAASESDSRTAAGVHTRASTRVRAVSEGGNDIAAAAEEPISVAGFAVDPNAAGSIIVAALGNGANLGLDTYAESGAFSTATFAARGPVRPPEYSSNSENSKPLSELAGFLQRRGFHTSLISNENASKVIETFLRQTRAAVNFYLSGAATATVLSRIAAAVHGLPGAPPELLPILGPSATVLAPGGEFIVKNAANAATSAAMTWRDADAQTRLRYFLGRLAKSEPVAADAPESWVYDLSPLNDLFRVGAFGIYLYLLTEGRESARIDSFLERAAIRHTKQMRLGELSHRAVIASARARLYITIIEDKFGPARGKAVLDALRTSIGSRSRGAPGGSLALAADSVQIDDPDAVLTLLTKREREVVETEYDNRRKEWEATVGNKCPHVRLVRRMRTATSSEDAIKALKELETYLSPEKGRGRRSDDDVDAGGRQPKDAAQAPETMWLSCQSCGFRALCPHVRDRIRMESRRVPAAYEEIRTRLLKYAMRVQSSDTDNYTYYCRICSEKLAEIIGDDSSVAESVGRFGDLDANLRTKIWTIAINAARNVRFPAPTDEKQFASAVAVVVYPLLMAAEEAVAKKGRRRKTSVSSSMDDDSEEIDLRTQLYIVLFVYAYILDLIQTSQTQNRAEIGFVGVKLGAKASAYAERMLRLITEEHRNLISQIEDISAEYLKARFTEAYRLVRGEGAAGLQTANPEEELAVQTTTIDPIYRYAATAASVAGDLPVARAVGPANARREFETVLGNSLTNIVKIARESARDPVLAPLYLRRTGIEVPTGGGFEFLIKDPRVNLYARLYEPNAKAAGADAIKAFRDIASAVKVPAPGTRFWFGAGENDVSEDDAGEDDVSENILKSVVTRGKPQNSRDRQSAGPRDRQSGGPRAKAAFRLEVRPKNPLALAERGAFFEAYRLFAEYTKATVNQKAYDNYLSELAAYRRSENGLRVSRAEAAVKTHFDFGFPYSKGYGHLKVPITAIYDEDGLRHDWSKKVTYIYRKGDSEIVEVKGGSSAVKAARENETLTPQMVLIDLACPICGVRASEVSKLDSSKAEQSVRAVSEMDSFFIFYESRCPSGGLHSWSTKGTQTCTECGLTATVLKEAATGMATKSQSARAYYNKYSEQFAEDRRKVRETSESQPIGIDHEANDSEMKKYDKIAAEWKPDYTFIVRAAELVSVTPATIEAIGSTEGREYSDIVEGRGVPPPPSAPSDPRIFTTDAEVRLFLSDYGALRNAARFAKMPPAISDLLTSSGVPKHEYAAIARTLPDVSENYHATFAAMARVRSPADTYSFAIQSLCRMALSVATGQNSGAPEWAARLGSAFAKQELQTILRSQKLFSKPGSFNWAIFETEDDAVQEQVGDVGEDVLEEMLIADGDDTADNPFSGENVDYDFSEDNPNNDPN